jgi:hypothetical protein
MNIGHDLMRSLGPRREHEPAPPPPSPHRRLAAIAVTVAGPERDAARRALTARGRILPAWPPARRTRTEPPSRSAMPT